MYAIGEEVLVLGAIDALTITAGAGTDGAETTGRTIDLSLLPGGLGAYDSVSLEIPWKASIASGKTLTYTGNFEHGDASNMSDTADVGTPLAATVAATGVLSAVYGSFKGPSLDLKGVKRYLRLMLTTDLSAAGTDTVLHAPVLVFKKNRRPATGF